MIRSLALAAFVTAMPLSSAIAQSSLAIDFADPASSDDSGTFEQYFEIKLLMRL